MTRSELEARLDEVAAWIPTLKIEYPDRCERMQAIAGELDVIEDAAHDAQDAAFVSRRVDRLLVEADLL